jgi:hypothetical protein
MMPVDKVYGCTITKAWRQLHQRASQTRALRVALVTRRGWIWRA